MTASTITNIRREPPLGCRMGRHNYKVVAVQAVVYLPPFYFGDKGTVGRNVCQDCGGMKIDECCDEPKRQWGWA